MILLISCSPTSFPPARRKPHVRHAHQNTSMPLTILGPIYYTHHGFWDLTASYFATWTFRVANLTVDPGNSTSLRDQPQDDVVQIVVTSSARTSTNIICLESKEPQFLESPIWTLGNLESKVITWKARSLKLWATFTQFWDTLEYSGLFFGLLGVPGISSAGILEVYGTTATLGIWAKSCKVLGSERSPFSPKPRDTQSKQGNTMI